MPHFLFVSRWQREEKVGIWEALDRTSSGMNQNQMGQKSDGMVIKNIRVIAELKVTLRQSGDALVVDREPREGGRGYSLQSTAERCIGRWLRQEPLRTCLVHFNCDRER